MAGNKQAEIMAAAVRLFHEQGFHATSMQDIADSVGLQKGSLYHYIGGKEDLLVVIMMEAIARYNRTLAEIRAMALPVRARLELAVRNHLMGIADNLSMLTIFLRESYALNPEQQELLGAEMTRYNTMFEELYMEGVAAGELRPLDPKLVSRTVLGACNWFYRWYRPEGERSLDELATSVVDILMSGIAAGSSAC
ncbi:MAG TPA: TetR/AcrR family transcriptional regulator [Symbiobacteriaceae bacterium]|nr:TetR/AcrR family transcriptional regulator [Symbiobacteriaceae bacterium]